MAEYIEREALLKHLCNSCDGWCDNTECDCLNCKSEHRCDIVQEMSEVPAADVAPVVHGEWVEKKRWGMGKWHKWLECSKCGHQDHNLDMYEDMPFTSPSNFCPNCGADMRERKGDGNG